MAKLSADEASVLTYVDQLMASMEEMDPSLADGFRAIYDREVPLELRVQESVDGPQQVGTMEALKVKVLVQGDDEGPICVRVEMSSESDLFYYYAHTQNEAGFQVMQENQKLMVDFPEYPNVLIRMFNDCLKEPQSHLAVFVMQQQAGGERTGHLDFIRNMEYKFVELMSVQFEHLSEEAVQQQITYRYNAMKSRLALVQARLQEVNNLVRLKNPSLLLQLQRSPTLNPRR